MKTRSLASMVWVGLVCVAWGAVTWPGSAWGQSFSVDLGQGGQAGTTSRLIQLAVAMGVLSLAPSLLVMTTAFTRIVIVLSLLRSGTYILLADWAGRCWVVVWRRPLVSIPIVG